MKIFVTFTGSMIAPCGINCGTCIAFLRSRNKCHGCSVVSSDKPKTRLSCRIKNCEQLASTTFKLCYECSIFPCQRVKQIDKRYRMKYHTSLIQNLHNIKETGMENFLLKESERWVCPECGSGLSVHKDYCLSCHHVLNASSSN